MILPFGFKLLVLHHFMRASDAPNDSGLMHRTVSGLGDTVKKWKNTQGYNWHRFKMRHTHWTVTSKSAGGGFVAYGCKRAVTHFSRSYLNSATDTIIKQGWHHWPSANVAYKQAARLGLIVVNQMAKPPGFLGPMVAWPRLVGIEADLTGGIDACRAQLSDSAESDLRRIEKQGFKMIIKPALAGFDEFYWRYYLPSMCNRHGEDAYLHDYHAEKREVGPEDVLVGVQAGDGCLAMLTMCKEVGGVRLCRLGWLNGRSDVYHRCVIAALYWFSMTYAIERGYTRLNFGAVTPYLEDGLFSYKEKWLGRLSWAKSYHDSWWVLADPKHPAVGRFFDHRSLLIKNEQTQRFKVISNRMAVEVRSAKTQMKHLDEWITPSQAWPTRLS